MIKHILAVCILFLLNLYSQDCLLVDSSAKLFKGNIDDNVIYQFTNNDFAKKVEFNDQRKKIFITFGKYSGWVEKDAVLCSNGNSGIISAMSKNPSLPLSLKKKALLVTNIENLSHTKINSKKEDLQVNIYFAPKQQDKYLSTQSKLFQMRYIYVQRKIDNQLYYLVGLNESANTDNASSVLQGWVSGEKVLEWNNRIGVEFDAKDKQKSKIYSTPKKDEVKYTEQDSDNMKYYEPRFPLIKKIDRHTFKIGFIGGASNSDITRGDIAKAKQIVNEVVQNNYLQIALLIDATKGMGPYFKDVTNAIESFLKTTKNKANVDIAIAIYRDYADGKKIYKIIKNFRKDSKINLSKIKTQSNPKDTGVGAYPEAVFYGINKSIKTLSWSKKNIEKYMIVLGDHGNHKDASQYKQEKKFTVSSLGSKLQKNLITLWGVQVANKATGKHLRIKQESLNRFKTQLNQIIAHNKNSSGKVLSYKKASKQDIYNALVKIYNNFSAIKVALGGVSKSENVQENTGFSAALLQRLGIDPKIFGHITQATSTGYIKRKKSGFKQKVLIKKRALERLKTSINSLSGVLYRGSYHDEIGQRQIKNTVIRIFQDLTGDTIKENENIKRFIFKKTGLPVQTKALKQSINRLIRKCANKQYRISLIQELEKKYIKIHAVLMEKEVQIGRFNSATGKYSFKEGKDKKYFYNLEQPIASTKGIIDNSQVLHAWIDISLFP